MGTKLATDLTLLILRSKQKTIWQIDLTLSVLPAALILLGTVAACLQTPPPGEQINQEEEEAKKGVSYTLCFVYILVTLTGNLIQALEGPEVLTQISLLIAIAEIVIDALYFINETWPNLLQHCFAKCCLPAHLQTRDAKGNPLPNGQSPMAAALSSGEALVPPRASEASVNAAASSEERTGLLSSMAPTG